MSPQHCNTDVHPIIFRGTSPLTGRQSDSPTRGTGRQSDSPTGGLGRQSDCPIRTEVGLLRLTSEFQTFQNINGAIRNSPKHISRSKNGASPLRMSFGAVRFHKGGLLTLIRKSNAITITLTGKSVNVNAITLMIFKKVTR